MKRALTYVVPLGMLLGSAAHAGPPEEASRNDPQYIHVEIQGILSHGVVAIGGETTGTLISARGITWELDLTKDKDLLALAGQLHGQSAWVTGNLEIQGGPEKGVRFIVNVSSLEPNGVPSAGAPPPGARYLPGAQPPPMGSPGSQPPGAPYGTPPGVPLRPRPIETPDNSNGSSNSQYPGVPAPPPRQADDQQRPAGPIAQAPQDYDPSRPVPPSGAPPRDPIGTGIPYRLPEGNAPTEERPPLTPVPVEPERQPLQQAPQNSQQFQNVPPPITERGYDAAYGPPPSTAIAPGAPIRVPTHAEFARSFRPMPGTYEVVLLHPYTLSPVPVRFSLPGGIPRKVRIERSELEFDYGDMEVEIRFRRDGRVSVEVND